MGEKHDFVDYNLTLEKSQYFSKPNKERKLIHVSLMCVTSIKVYLKKTAQQALRKMSSAKFQRTKRNVPVLSLTVYDIFVVK